MGIVFAVLALLALSIKALSMLDREPTPVVQAASVTADTGMAAPIASSADEGISGQQIAAIAVALALSEQQDASGRSSNSPVSASSASPAGSWLQSGRTRLLGSNTPGSPINRTKRSN
jgi:Na+-transporting methylmalonyl-CoA/oxaloacetate decarboxylase gamma subunit